MEIYHVFYLWIGNSIQSNTNEIVRERLKWNENEKNKVFM